MTDGDRWLRVRELFERALEEAPADPGAWLERHAPADHAVRDEVLSLLTHHSQAGSFLDQPASNELTRLLQADRLEPGQAIGPYIIEREIGRGGMGRVYLASDERLGRPVALKAISPELAADPAQRERLRREARAAGALTHPGICTIYALEEFDGDLFIAAEFIDGRTLREEIDQGARPPAASVLAAARELAAALADAHRKGITHRDLKPENVMRTSDGRLKILDFGLASLGPVSGWSDAHDEGHVDPGRTTPRALTRPGAVLGTPAYMAPEQLNGEAVDARTDVFALGVLVYEYACGVHPFEAATPLAVAARILESQPLSLDRRRPDLPGSLVTAVERCLRKSPTDRFASARDLLHALDTADTAGLIHRVAVWWRTHQVAVVALYVIACGLAWQIKEWLPGVTTPIFVAMSALATIGAVFRGHLLFSERVTRDALAHGRRLATPVTLVTDLALALLLVIDGLLLTGSRPLMASLTIGLGVGIALARVVVEPSTAAATFKA